MKTTRRAASCAALLLVLGAALLGPAGASRLHLHTPAIRRLEGKATLLTLDKPNTKKPQKLLNVVTDLGEQVLILGDAALAAGAQEARFAGGARVSLQGVFLSRGAGSVRVVSGHPIARAQYCFAGNNISALTPSRSLARGAAAQTVTYGPAPPLTGTVLLAPRAASATALGRPGGPSVAASAADELLPRDEAGVPIASAAWVGLGPDGLPMPRSGRRSLSAIATPAAKFVNNTLVMDRMTTIIIPISANESTGAICPGTSKPRGCPNTPCTTAQLKKVLFSSTTLGGGGGNADTVGRGFEKCSFGKTKFEATAKVAEIVNIPCSGITNGVSWTFTKCDFDDFNGYADKADEVLASRGINMDKYRYAVYLLPPSIGCNWVGLGYVGCDGSYRCRVWISGDFWMTAQAYVHELQHNMFLNHAAGYNEAGELDEYHDSTCPMGHCCTSRCPNVVHGWQMGWYPVQQFDAAHLKPGTTIAVKLAPGATQAKAPLVQGVRLNITWSKLAPEPLFIGYRTKAVYTPDYLLDATLVNRVHIYSSNVQNTFDASLTTYKTSLAYKTGCNATTNPPCVWSVADVVVRVTASTPSNATVNICRKVTGGKETRATCLARVDGDCNGRVNASDSNCVNLLRTAKPKATAVPLPQPASVAAGALPAPVARKAAVAAPGGGKRKLAAAAAEEHQPRAMQRDTPFAQPGESEALPGAVESAAPGGT